MTQRSLAVIVLSLCAASATAHAQASGAQAEELFRQGRDLMAAGKIDEACDAFAESQKLDPAVTTLLNLAGCHEKLGKFATAWGEFLDAERQTRSATDKTTVKLHDVAQQKATALESQVSHLTINVPEASNVDGLAISLGSDPIDPVMWNRAMPVDGGTYTITAKAPGANPWSTQVTVGGQADTKTIDIPDLRNLPQDLTPKKVTPKAPDTTVVAVHATPTPGPAKPSKTLPILVSVGAAALLGGGVGFELWGESDYNSAKAETSDQARRDSLYQSANTKRFVAEGMVGAGIACAGVAVWLFVRHPAEHRDEVAGVHLVASPTGFAVIGAF